MALNIHQLGQMVLDKRGTLGVRAAAREVGISPATLSRVENGNLPDLETFAAICKWLGEDPSQFLGMQKSDGAETSVSVHMRKKKTTSIETANALGSLIVAAQQAIRDRESL